MAKVPPSGGQRPESQAKRQRSILEFTRTRRAAPEFIDLTEEIDIKEEVMAIKTEMECPMCSLNITYYTFDDRCRHVDFCMARDTSKEEAMIKSEITSANVTKTTITETTITEIGSKRRKLLPPNPNTKYINKLARSTTKDKIIKPPTKITQSRAKRPIPEVKVMDFPVTRNSLYQVSVDAFCYAPHETIDQYFLSHFHSDHYGGISKKWSYERVFKDNADYEDDLKYRKIIYCTKITGKLLSLRFSVDPKFIKHLELDTRYMISRYLRPQDKAVSHLSTSSSTEFVSSALPDGGAEVLPSQDLDPGLYVTSITANHCPGSAIFLFESLSLDGKWHRILHCGDFRVNKTILCHPLLSSFATESGSLILDKVYLDTTYMSPLYNFPKQELVCDTVSDLFYELSKESTSLFSTWFGALQQSRITDFLIKKAKKKKFLIIVGTYLIGKERLAMAVLKRLNCMIYNLNIKSRDDKADILKTYEDEYLDLVLTDDDLGGDKASCVVHLVPMAIVSSIGELSNYFNHNNYHQHFERCVGLRPTGWSFQPRYAKEESIEPDLISLFSIMNESPTFSFVDDILPQVPTFKGPSTTKYRPDTSLYRIYSVPYSEHSSFRELAYFVVFFKIGDVIPTVNIHNPASITKMRNIISCWELARKHKIQPEDSSLAQSFNKLSLERF